MDTIYLTHILEDDFLYDDMNLYILALSNV